MKINKLLTKINYNKGNNKQNKYIVIHYVGATGSAENNCKYFEKVYRAASAHYFVNHDGAVWQCVEDKDTAWHCGALKYKHKECRNTNSIGIEMCCRKDAKGKWYFEAETVLATIELTKELMTKYNIPVSNVLRHYDITGKTCPEPYVRNTADWENFKIQLTTIKPAVIKVDKTQYFPKYSGTTGSIVDALKAVGANSSYSYRVKIAKANGITAYIGSAAQNTQMVKLLKQGKLVKP